MAAVEAQFPALRPDAGRRDLHLCRGAARHRHGQGRPVEGIARPRGLGGERAADRHRRQADHLPPHRPGRAQGGAPSAARPSASGQGLPELDDDVPVLNPVDVALPVENHLDEAARRRLLGRYGADAPALVGRRSPASWSRSPARRPCGPSCAGRPAPRAWSTWTICCCAGCGWATCCRKAARSCCHASGPSASRSWAGTTPAGRRRRRPISTCGARCYSLPERETIPDWRAMLAEARAKRAAARPTRRRKVIKRSALAGGLAALAALVAMVYWRRRRGGWVARKGEASQGTVAWAEGSRTGRNR